MKRAFTIREAIARLARQSPLEAHADLWPLIAEPFRGAPHQGLATLDAILAEMSEAPAPTSAPSKRERKRDRAIAALLPSLAPSSPEAIERRRPAPQRALEQAARLRPTLDEAQVEAVLARAMVRLELPAIAPRERAEPKIPNLSRRHRSELDPQAGLQTIVARDETPVLERAARTPIVLGRREEKPASAPLRDPPPTSELRRDPVPAVPSRDASPSPAATKPIKGLRWLTEWWSEQAEMATLETNAGVPRRPDTPAITNEATRAIEAPLAEAPPGREPTQPPLPASAPPQLGWPDPERTQPEDLRREIERILESEAERFGIAWEDA